MFGLHPGLAFLTFIVDAMLFGGEAGSLGTSFLYFAGRKHRLGIIAYKAQMKWYGDDSENAGIKAAILAFLPPFPHRYRQWCTCLRVWWALVHTLRRKV